MAALLSESGRQPVLVSHTVHPEKFTSVISVGPNVLPDSSPTLRCESSGKDQEKSATTSLPNTGVSPPENVALASSTSSTNQTTRIVNTSADLGPPNGADNVAERMQLDSQELDENLDDEGLRELQSDYERRREERKKEQDLAALERQRLEEIFRICSEYDHTLEAPKDSNRSVIDERRDSAEKRDSASSRSSWGSSMKIKTNGSLTSSGIYNRRSEDVIASSADNYASDATKQSNGRAESKSYTINTPKPSNGDAMSHPYVINAAKPSNRLAESDPIQSRPVETGSDRTVGKSYARILKLSSDTMDINNWNKPNGVEARLSSKGSDLSDALKLSSADLSDAIDDDNISTDCFQEESSFSVVSSENSFQTTSPTQNGNRNRYDGNRSVSYVPAEVVSKRPENKNSQWNPSESVLGHQSRENRYQVCKNCVCTQPISIVDYIGLKPRLCSPMHLS